MNKTVKSMWIISGILIFVCTAFWFIKVKILNESGIVGNVIKFTIGLYLLVLYIIISIGYWINRSIYKERTKKLRKNGK